MPLVLKGEPKRAARARARTRACARGGAAALLPALVCLLMAAPCAAAATTVTDVGEGFPVALGGADAVLLAGAAKAEEGEVEYLRPWSIWSAGKTKTLTPLNGEPAEASPEEEAHHVLHLGDINEAGEAVGTSSLAATKEGKPAVAFHPVVFDAEGAVRDLGVLQDPLTEKTGEPEELKTFPGGGFGTAINDSGQAVGEGVIDVEGKITPRAFLYSGGSQHVVGLADGLAKPWRSAAFFINDAGLMFGEVAEIGEATPPHYYLWPDATSPGTALNFDAEVQAHDLANDGSVLGVRKGQLYLRLPKGEEQAISGLSDPGQVNSSHQVVGSETVKGAEHAAVWSAGSVTDLNTRLPEKSGWVLERAYAINDAGDIAGVGTHEGKKRVFLLQGGLLASISGAPSAAAPESGTVTETFTVTLPAAGASTVTVGYRTEDGTATAANNDYTPTSGTLTFLPGETSKNIEVQIDAGNGHDTAAREHYRVRLQATATAGVSAAAGSAEGEIGYPGLGGELVAAPASGAAGKAAPVPGMKVQVAGRSASGQEVSQTVTSDAEGKWEANVDAGSTRSPPRACRRGSPQGSNGLPRPSVRASAKGRPVRR